MKARDAMRHVGLHSGRLTADRPLEIVFAEAWEDANYPGLDGTCLINYLLSKENRPGDVSERDISVAATIIQWLGTSVGQEFLRDVSYKAMQGDAAP